jgi:hypothetical protein
MTNHPITPPPYWAAIWFVIITGIIATAVHLAYGPFPRGLPEPHPIWR